MKPTALLRPAWALACALSMMAFSGNAAADPSARAARLGVIGGTVSLSPAGQPDWVQATINRPLTTGDRLWSGDRSRAEVQIGGTAIRLGPSTSMALLNLDDRIAQLQLSQGSLKIRVRSIDTRQTFEVATPNLAFTLNRAGDYRIEVAPEGDATMVRVDSGEAVVYGEGASYTVDSRGSYRFYGTDLTDYDILATRADDDLDRWSLERDRRAENSPSARYVSTEVVGYEDLDANGTWRVDATYGNVWAPARVATDWTPYRDGHWSWVDPWGWTWVDDAPWGYAVSHYGRWASINGAWAWVPGPRQERAVYAPALVAFVGGTQFQPAGSAGSTLPASIGWFPLAPREVYRPSYPASRGYFDNINRSNASVAPTQLNTVYNTTIVNNTTTIVNNTHTIVYANQRVTGAVVAVPAQAFVQSQPVARTAVRLAPETVLNAPVLHFAGIAPVRQSVQGGAHEAATPPAARERAVVARTAPPAPPLAFAAQQAQLSAKPGTPMDEDQRRQLKPATPAATAPKVSVIAASTAPTASAPPPPAAASRRAVDARNADAARSEVTHGPARKPDVATPPGVAAEAANAAASRNAEVRAEQVRAESAKAEAAKAQALQGDAANAAAARAGMARAEALKQEAARGDALKAAAARDRAAKGEAAHAEAAKTEGARVDALRAESVKLEAARAAAVARANAAALTPKPPASGPKPKTDRNPEDEKKKDGRQP
jgi:hypothetical protein